MSPRRRVTLRAQWLGQQLRELREANGLTLSDAADYLQRNQATVGRFETAEYPIRRPDVMALLDLYGVSDGQQRTALMKLSEDVWQKGWWDGYADEVAGWFVDYVWVESRATEIRSFDDTLLPGLLQTPRYAEAAIRAADPEASADQVARWIELRMTRQQVLAGEDPPQLMAILDEALLHRLVGGPEVIREQLLHLVACANLSNIQMRLLPFRTGAHASPSGAFKLFTMADPYPEVAYAETPAGAIYVETPDTDRFEKTYDRMWKATLGAAESAELISATAEGLQ